MLQLAMIQSDSPQRLRAWIDAIAPADVEAAENTALLSMDGALCREPGGRTAGALAGVLFNDHTVSAPLVDRGLLGADASHSELVAAAVGQGGPNGLASLRMQGVGMVFHVAQRQALAWSGAVGVAPLYLARLEGGWAATTDLRVLAALGQQRSAFETSAPDVATWVGARTAAANVVRVVAGTALLLGARGPQVERVRWQDDAVPFLRNPSDDIVHATAADALALLTDAIADAAAATERGLGRLWLGPAHNDCQRWVRALVHQRGLGAEEAAAKCRWSFLGARTLTERMRWPGSVDALLPATADHSEDARIAALQRQWDASFEPPAIRPPFAEPLPKDDPVRAGQRWLRHTLFSHGLAARAWQRCADRGWAVAMPHLDPKVLALAGALPSEVLQACVGRVPGTEIAQG